MTCPVVIGGAEQWSRWSNMNHPDPAYVGGLEGRNRLPVGGNRLLPVLKIQLYSLRVVPAALG
jgi:hypothetical protein